jgi:hypothetical protein
MHNASDNPLEFFTKLSRLIRDSRVVIPVRAFRG